MLVEAWVITAHQIWLKGLQVPLLLNVLAMMENLSSNFLDAAAVNLEVAVEGSLDHDELDTLDSNICHDHAVLLE